MALKNYDDFSGSEFADYDHNWEVVLNDNTDSWWEYKEDAIDRILEIYDIIEFDLIRSKSSINIEQ